MKVTHQVNQQLDEKHMFKTLMQNVETRQRLIEMYHELISQQQSSLITPTTKYNAPLINLQNSSHPQMQQSIMGTTSVVPLENSLYSWYGTNFHHNYQIIEKIGEGGQGSVYSGKQRLRINLTFFNLHY